eukprot:359258-Chlamydomonas_euryale.AAC.19
MQNKWLVHPAVAALQAWALARLLPCERLTDTKDKVAIGQWVLCSGCPVAADHCRQGVGECAKRTAARWLHVCTRLMLLAARQQHANVHARTRARRGTATAPRGRLLASRWRMAAAAARHSRTAATSQDAAQAAQQILQTRHQSALQRCTCVTAKQRLTNRGYVAHVHLAHARLLGKHLHQHIGRKGTWR